MNDLPLPSTGVLPLRLPWYHWRRFGFNFLTISVLVHLLLGIGAGYLIVQTIQAKRKQTFAGPAQAPNAPTRAMEHQVKMQQKQKTMSAPAPLKRITTTSNTRLALPALPAMPKTDTAIVPLSMAGMGGLGTGLSMGGGGGSGGGGGGGMNLFGLRTPGQGIAGSFYDLKQTTGRQPTKMTPALYGTKIEQFVAAGFDDKVLAPYFRAPTKLYATQLYTPSIPATLGPAAFNMEKEVAPKMWCVHYKGYVTPPASGSFYFAGMGDDILLVRLDGKEVLDACYSVDTHLQGQEHYKMHFHAPSKGFTKGIVFHVEANHSYPIEIVIGEQPGGYSCVVLNIGQEGQTYQKEANGDLLLPIFRMSSNTKLAPTTPALPYAPHAEGGPIWPASSSPPSSIFDR